MLQMFLLCANRKIHTSQYVLNVNTFWRKKNSLDVVVVENGDDLCGSYEVVLVSLEPN